MLSLNLAHGKYLAYAISIVLVLVWRCTPEVQVKRVLWIVPTLLDRQLQRQRQGILWSSMNKFPFRGLWGQDSQSSQRGQALAKLVSITVYVSKAGCVPEAFVSIVFSALSGLEFGRAPGRNFPQQLPSSLVSRLTDPGLIDREPYPIEDSLFILRWFWREQNRNVRPRLFGWIRRGLRNFKFPFHLNSPGLLFAVSLATLYYFSLGQLFGGLPNQTLGGRYLWEVGRDVRVEVRLS